MIGPDATEINRAYYEAEAPGRDAYWRKMAAPRHRVEALLGELVAAAPQAVVDLGCGNGAFLAELRRHLPGTRLAGLDMSSRQIESNRKTDPTIDWRVSNLDGAGRVMDGQVPVEWNGLFDAVIAMELIEHLDDPVSFLRNARLLAAPGRGRLYLSTQSGPVRETERRVGHRRHFSRSDMQALLSTTGWNPTKVWNTGFPFHDLSKWYANLNPDASMARFGNEAYTWREDLVCLGLRQAFRLNSRRRGAQLFAVAQNFP